MKERDYLQLVGCYLAQGCPAVNNLFLRVRGCWLFPETKTAALCSKLAEPEINI